uniref:Cytochrome c oxidase assembly protein COX16 homolog, mitochondrial n=1 Tax=Trichuris muris TaxID=70415 RepID=A0A5S6Q4E2_TRIMR
MLFGKHIFEYGLPFLAFVAVGSFGLRYFTQLRLDYRTTVVSRKALSDVGVDPDKTLTLDQLYELFSIRC